MPTTPDGANPMGTSPKIAPNQKWAEQGGLDEKTLRGLYAEMSDREIAVKFGVSDAIIGYYRRKWGIPTLTPRQRADKARIGQPTLDDLTPALLTSLYAQDGRAADREDLRG